jgi:hypothetical protein
MFCSGSTVSYSDIHSALSVDTAFHSAFRAAAAKRITKHVAEKLAHMRPEAIKTIQRHISYAVNYATYAWMVVVNDSDEVPIFVIRNVVFGEQSAVDRKVYTIALLKEAKEDFMEYVSYTFNVLLTSLLLVHVLQFIAHLSVCTYRQ